MNIKELLDDHQLYMSTFQHEHLIIMRAGGTLYGQYKQALREMYKRLRGLRETVCDRELLLIEIEEHEAKTTNESDEFAKRKATVEAKRKTMQLEEINRVVDNTMREFISFYKQAVTLKGQLGEINAARRDELERELWEYQIVKMAQLDWASRGRVGENTLDYALSLDGEMRERVLGLIKQPVLLEVHVEALTRNAVSILSGAEGADIEVPLLEDLL